MPFTTPLALLGLLFLPAVVAMYLLKLRRERSVVPSTLLWQRLNTDVEANAPWQRLRRSLLLLLQLLLVAILALLAARPFVERPAGLAGDIVLVIDASASMGATDVAPHRLAAAREAALAALRDLPAGGRVSVVAAGATARMVANQTSDLGRVRQAIESIEVAPMAGDMTDALALASALAARSADSEILIATDAAIATPPAIRVEAPIRVLPVGRDRRNQAIVALAVRTAPSGVTRSAFVSVANLDIESARRRIALYGDGNPNPIEVQDVVLDPQARQDIVVDEIPPELGVLEVRLLAAEDAPGDPDQLAVDDRAWAVVPPDRLRTILLVSEGDPYLETALSYLPNTELWGVAPGRYPQDARRADGTSWDLIIFQGFVPRELPVTPVLAIAPPRTSPFGEVRGDLREPGIGSLDPDEPILRYVDLSTTHIGAAKRLTLPDWARTIVPGPANSPLLYSGELEGYPAAVLAFEPRQSDLPLQVAFPILLANLTGELMGGRGGPVEAVAPGAPVSLTVPAGARALRVERPDGSSAEVVPGTLGGSSVTFSQTDLPGVYTVTPIRDPEASPSVGVSGSPFGSPSPIASASPAPSTSPDASGPPVDPDAPVRFAVDLFDAAESNIAPGSPSAIEALGGAGPLPSAEPSASPGATRSPTPSSSATASPEPSGGATGGPTAPRPPARDELWIPIVLIVLAFLTIEWAVYQRDALIRVWRAASARLGRAPGGAR